MKTFSKLKFGGNLHTLVSFSTLTQLKDKENVNEEKLFFCVPYVGKSSQLFTKQLSKIIANLTAVKLIPTYKTFQVGNYFNLKSRTPTPLVSNVVYRFSCPREVDLTYIGKSARHLVTKAKEHWSLTLSGRGRGVATCARAFFKRLLF